jgi:hypothetical protein
MSSTYNFEEAIAEFLIGTPVADSFVEFQENKFGVVADRLNLTEDRFKLVLSQVFLRAVGVITQWFKVCLELHKRKG